MANRNCRRSARRPVVASVRVGWQDETGAPKSVLTRSFDISETGICFELFQPLRPRTDLMLRCEKIALQTRAVVRYCSQKGLKYSIGVEFAGGYRWVAPSEEVRRVLDEADMLMV